MEDAALYKGDINAKEAWDMLRGDAESFLIDVRTDQEWEAVGYPDLSVLSKRLVKLSWRLGSNKSINPDFTEELEKVVGDKNAAIIFICRSGGRSAETAVLATKRGYTNCYNLIGGFEGHYFDDKDKPSYPGWVENELPWRNK
jgi:rhodanese-related sulfurtransferase